VLTRATLEGWGWRLAFLVTLPLGLVGLYLRRRLDETPRFRAVQRARAVVRRPVAEAVRGYPGRLLTGLALVAVPFLGRLSDRVGRRPLLVAGTLALLVVILPAFLAALLVRHRQRGDTGLLRGRRRRRRRRRRTADQRDRLPAAGHSLGDLIPCG
jgi:MFS family permease